MKPEEYIQMLKNKPNHRATKKELRELGAKGYRKVLELITDKYYENHPFPDPQFNKYDQVDYIMAWLEFANAFGGTEGLSNGIMIRGKRYKLDWKKARYSGAFQPR